ncbi:MAG: hypothetical protein JEY79_19105 [Pseudodesulfovibrio sp.]|nr:hypothetical protein [Pseudodesulfovibrio sp.]
MGSPYIFKLRHDQNGRIIKKTETVNGKSIKWTYSYDNEGRLFEAHLDGQLVCQCQTVGKDTVSKTTSPEHMGARCATTVSHGQLTATGWEQRIHPRQARISIHVKLQRQVHAL